MTTDNRGQALDFAEAVIDAKNANLTAAFVAQYPGRDAAHVPSGLARGLGPAQKAGLIYEAGYCWYPVAR